MSKPSSCHAEPESSADPARRCGGTNPGHVDAQQLYSSTVRKKSSVRLNDQLIPKPSDIDVSEKMIKSANLKEHPYASHISRFAMFPSFLSPDDPERGVRAASQTFLNSLIPNKAPDVTLISKTIGGPYRHEILETPLTTRKMAVSWTGENGFLDHPKPIKGKTQIFYPAPPKIVLPNQKLRDWDLSLSERTSNMLRNLERKLWITSYQMDFTGSGPANPLKTDDFKEKISCLAGMNSYSAPLRETSYPVFVPSKPKGGCGRRQRGKLRESSLTSNVAGVQGPSAHQTNVSSNINQQQPQELVSNYNEATAMTQMDQTGFEDVQHTDSSIDIFQKQEPWRERGVYHDREGKNHNITFNKSLTQEFESKSDEDLAVPLSNIQALNLNNQPSHQRVAKVTRDRNVTGLQTGHSLRAKNEPLRVGNPLRSESHDDLLPKEDGVTAARELLSSLPNTGILPRPPVLPGIPHTDTSETAGRTGTALSLLDLQDSFSKTEAHCRFNSSVTRAAANLRDNLVTGRRHSFYGINCNYIHG